MDSLFENSSIQSRSKRNLSNQQRQAIFDALLIESKEGKLKRGTISKVAALFSVNRITIHRIWKRGKTCFANGLVADVSSKQPTNVGRKRVQIELSKISELDLRRRTNLRSLSTAMNVPKTTLFRRLKEGGIRPHTNALKPCLSDDTKRARLQFCLSMLEASDHGNQPAFKSMYDYVHIDEKWFFMTKEAERFYLLPEEREPLRTCKSKRFITKVMFLAAVARPRFDAARNQHFSAVEKSFEELSSESLDRVFLSMQACMIEIMKVQGGNNYKLPHIGKSKLIRDGNLPTQLQCDRDLVEKTVDHLQQINQSGGV